MSFAARHNKGSVFTCNTEGFEYKKPVELYNAKKPDQVFPIQGLYINKKSKYGNAPVAICEDCFVNFPAHMLEEVEAILKSSEDIEDIKAGKVGFIIEPYTTDEGNTCYGIRWADLD